MHNVIDRRPVIAGYRGRDVRRSYGDVAGGKTDPGRYAGGSANLNTGANAASLAGSASSNDDALHKHRPHRAVRGDDAASDRGASSRGDAGANRDPRSRAWADTDPHHV
ncbi:MAG: hypothetical protein IIC29_02390 [Chloroflexi bacterium]|nr:hypothetical protein [Chloroflexota bacterium]